MELPELDTPLAREMTGEWLTVALANEAGDDEIYIRIGHSGSLSRDAELAELSLTMMQAIEDCATVFPAAGWNTEHDGAAMFILERRDDGALKFGLVSDATTDMKPDDLSPAQALGIFIYEALQERLGRSSYEIADVSPN